MSQNCKSTYSPATTRDANNNTLYHGAATPGYGGRGYTPPSVKSGGNYQVSLSLSDYSPLDNFRIITDRIVLSKHTPNSNSNIFFFFVHVDISKALMKRLYMLT
ncbi:jg12130 [Pararge aegeria aegeria]|uniref:Jg12130 protein n=1 Tax=Pararge aegeria aegeria TaxID=348720 RepID=A0A8S4QVD5_9NEOP|nr:jg12130 [Pararge aegeria aegeria]